MTEIVATNVIASQPPDQGPTAMPNTRAKNKQLCALCTAIEHIYCNRHQHRSIVDRYTDSITLREGSPPPQI